MLFGLFASRRATPVPPKAIPSQLQGDDIIDLNAGSAELF
jgi:hypothetical protein